MAREDPIETGELTIRPLGAHDAQGAMDLSSMAGWNQRLDDWRMLIDLGRGRGFGAVSRGRLVGTAIGIDYGAFSWIAGMLVHPSCRGRGLGRRLLDAALDAVPADTPVRLDATPMGRPLYASCGFEDERLLTRWMADAPRADRSTAVQSAVRRMVTGDVERVALQDRQVTGASRRAVLEWARLLAPQYAYISEVDAESGPIQYCFGRHGRVFEHIGPLVAASEQVARALAGQAIAAAAGKPTILDVFDEHDRFAAWLRTCSFEPQRPLFRMRREPRRPSGARPAGTPAPDAIEFAILGPDFG